VSSTSTDSLGSAEAERLQTRAVRVISAATGITSLAMTLWFPFLPLFMLQVGATDAADAIFWVAVAQSVQGVMRLVSGPLWGMLADRQGRKKMFVRTLYSAALTTFVLSAIGAPWQASIALGLHGLLSGFVPAAIALTSVTVPDGKMKNALSLVSGSQYLGSAIGPMIGAALVIALGYRGAILSSGLMVIVVATIVVYLVPADTIKKKVEAGEGADGAALEPFKFTLQLALATFIYFMLFALNTFRGVATPIALQGIAGEDVTHVTGIAFGLGGIASALGIWLLSWRMFKGHKLGSTLLMTTLLLAASHFLLAHADSVVLFVLWFTVISLLNAAMSPVTNMLIAFNVSRARRGTGFGIASSAQAVAFMAGPMAAAWFATTSLQTGFAILGGMLVGLALLIRLVLKEPSAKE
jgi:DHA1 family multidrug resistance protein-like MFS transporter